MSDVNSVSLTREELFDFAKQCATDPASIIRTYRRGNRFAWEWPFEEDSPMGILEVSVVVDADRIAGEQTTGRTWIKPHHLMLRYYPSDSGDCLQEVQFEFPPSLLGIEPDGNPRPTLAALISRQTLTAAT